MTAEILHRLQFAFTAAFHYLFPPMTIGLGLILVIMEGTYLITKKPIYHQMTRFWVMVYALNFAVGVVTGIPLEFQFGTNWSNYSRYVGDIFGSALAAEGVFAFFLESGFLAILVFGWNKVTPKWHFFSTCMVFLGSIFSATWILVANSWQQTPAGFKVVETEFGTRAHITDFWAMVFNPSTIDRFTHTVTGCLITGAFLVMSVSAYYLVKKQHREFSLNSMKIAMALGLITCVLQMYLGHMSTVNLVKNQPSKFAAIEGHYDSNKPLDLVLLGNVNTKTGEVSGLKIPGGGGILLNGDPNTKVKGFDQIPEQDRPPVTPVFQSFRIMVGLGVLMLGMTLLGTFLVFTNKIENATWFLKALVPAILLPHLANNTGWMVAEIGRQPWSVYGLLRTSESFSPRVTVAEVAISLGLFVVLYAGLAALWLYLLDKRIKAGPENLSIEAEHGFAEKVPVPLTVKEEVTL